MSIANDEIPETEESPLASAKKEEKEIPAVSATGSKKSPGEKVYAKFTETESALAILKSELFSLSPEELKKFQLMKQANVGNKENLSALQIRLIKIVKESDETFIRALLNVVNSLKSVHEKKD
jgi:hypothetical protein